MDPQVRVHPLVDVNSVVDESLGLCPAPGLARAQVEPEACVLPARDEPLLSRAVAFPVELAARIDEPLSPEIRAVKQVPDERVRIIELRIRGDDDTRLLRLRDGGVVADLACAGRTAAERYSE